MDFHDLSTMLQGREQAVRFLQGKGILHQQRYCPSGHEMTLTLSRSVTWRCNKRTCRLVMPIRTNTWFAGTKLDFKTAILFMYSWSHGRTTTLFCENELHINKNTSVEWNSYMREVCATSLLNNPSVIGGPGLTVEIAESLFSKRKNNVNHVLPEQWVFGGICQETRECFLVPVPERSGSVFIQIIKQYIRPGTTIISDEWKEHNHLSEEDYVQLCENHSLNFVRSMSRGAPAQSVKSMWGTEKFKNKTRRGIKSMLNSYIYEFMWRTKLNSDDDPFKKILEEIVEYWSPM